MEKVFYSPSVDDAEIKACVKRWQEGSPDGGVLMLVAEAEREQIPHLQDVFNDLSVPLVGAMFPELIIDGVFQRSGVLLIHFPQMPQYRLVSGVSESVDVLEEHVDYIEDNVSDSKVMSLFLIFDGVVTNIASVLESLYGSLADQVNYMGVNAGSETFQPMPCLFDNKQLVGDAVLMMLMPDLEEAVLEHCYNVPETTIMATGIEGNKIVSIDWRPAFDVYQEMIKSEYAVDVTPETFYEYGVHFPFGIIRADGEPLVRIPVMLDDDGALFCVGEIPDNAMLSLLHAVDPDNDVTVDLIVEHLNPGNEQSVLGFYCAGRRMHLGDAAPAELLHLYQRLGSKHLVGALSLGEIGNSRKGGYPLFHNAAILCGGIK